MKKPYLIAAIGALMLVIAVGIAIYVQMGESRLSGKSHPGETTEPRAEKIIPPTFDVVRVNREGSAVMAGRAHPGSTVEIMDGENVFGSVTTDARGEWVFVPEHRLEPGEHRLGLKMLLDGNPPQLSEQVVLLNVPEKGEGALALKVNRDGSGPSEVLQKPGPAKPATALSIDSVDYGNGDISISGRADAGKTVNLYIDNSFIGGKASDEAGRWAVSPERDIAPGNYRLRADQIEQDGRVSARVEIPFQRSEIADTDTLKPGSFVVVQPGNSLWRIATRAYGKGLRYHLIYEANSEQIRDADMIYPGQVFRLPSQ